MSEFSIKELSTILEMLDKHEVTEFKLERGEEKLSLRRGKPAPRRVAYPTGMQHMQQMLSPTQAFPSNVIPMVSPAPQNMQPQAIPTRENTEVAVETVPRKALKEITSPMVGTFYRRPAVDAEPYVHVGDAVKKGDVLCIVEAMKLMNEIESEVGGTIVEVLVENGKPVEYGDKLFRVRKS